MFIAAEIRKHGGNGYISPVDFDQQSAVAKKGGTTCSAGQGGGNVPQTGFPRQGPRHAALHRLRCSITRCLTAAMRQSSSATERWGYQMSQRRAQRSERADAHNGGTSRGRLFRARFIAECAEHLSDADAIAELVERPEDYFQPLWLESVLANRLGHPPPHPWFTEFCMRYITDDIDGLVRAGPARRADA